MVNCQGSYYSVSYGPTALKICHDTVHQKVAEQNYYNSNRYEEKYHLLILVMVKSSQPRQARTPACRNPDSIPPSDRHWLLVARSADFANGGPTLACQPLLRLDFSIFCRRWANGGFLFKMAVSNNRGFGET